MADDWCVRECRQTIPNVNKLLAQTPNEDLSLPLGANGHLYGVAAVKSSCPSGMMLFLLSVYAAKVEA
jgi:hypothetical protein